MTRSIQTRLTLLVLFAVLLFGLIAGYASYLEAVEETDEIFDTQLAQFAQNMMVLASPGDTTDAKHAEPPPSDHELEKTISFQIWNIRTDQPQLILRSNSLADITFSELPAEGFSHGRGQHMHWRYYRLRNEQRGLDILTGQSDEVRDEMAEEIAWRNLTPFLVGLPPFSILAIMAIRLGLRPLRRLAASLRRLTPEQLQPVALHDTPDEIAPVVDALNGLLNRIAKALENERRFTADASHELRTPLAALQAQLQAAQLSADKAERDEALAKAFHGAERMAHLVGQLLTLSRLDELSSLSATETVNLRELTEECCADQGSAALAKHIEIAFSTEAAPIIPGSADMLRILLRNLLDNAIRYTSHDGRVEVILRIGQAHQVELEIADSGIGVAEDKLAVLGQRFNRIAPNAAEGVGLGLSIVQRIAEFHHAQVAFRRSAMLGGLSVTVSFPLAGE